KQAIFPDITIWESHGMTIAMVTIIATALSYVTARRWDDVNSKLARTILQQQRAERELLTEQTALEERVRERTHALSEQNDALQREIAERVRAEAALRTSEAHLAEAERIARLGNWVWSGGDTIWRSEEVLRLLELDESAALTLDDLFSAGVHPEDRA